MEDRVLEKEAIQEERGNPEGQPISFYVWTKNERTFLRLTSRTLQETLRKSGLIVDITKVPAEEMNAVVGKAVIALLSWTCRDEPLAGDISSLEKASEKICAYDLSDTREYPLS